MMDELVKRLRSCVDSLCGECKYQQLQKPGNFVPCMNAMITEAADAIEELVGFVQEAERDRDEYRERLDKANDVIEELSAKVYSLQFFADNISKLPDCNTCLKKGMCEFMPRYGDYCRINCPAWLGAPEPPKEET